MKEFKGDQNSIDELIENAMDKIKGLMDSSTVIGEPILTPDGTTIIPVSKVSIGYVVGGGEFSDKCKKTNSFPLAGGSGGGLSVTPIGFLVETADSLNFIDTYNKNTYETILNVVNAIAEKVKAGKENKKENIDEKTKF